MSKAAELAKAGETLTNQPSGRKNMVTNGAMQIAQRSVSVTGLGANGDSYPTVDRFAVSQTATAGRYTMTQTADGPSGFANCIKLDCTTADTSIAATEFLILRQRIEGQNVQVFAKGTSDAKKYALSFYVKGNAAATYVAEFMDNDNSNRHVSKAFAVTTDWTRIEMIFPADTTGVIDDDNGASFDLNIWLHSGSNRTSGTLQQTWGALAQANRAVGISSFFDSTNRTFFITGVQLEVGSQATNFEHRSFGEESLLCQRYCTVHNMSGDADEYVIPYSQGQVDSANRAEIHILYPEKRAAPTITVTNPTNFKVMTGANTAITAGSFAGALVGTGIHGANLFWGVSGGIAVNDHTGNIKNIYLFQNTGAITIDAEL